MSIGSLKKTGCRSEVEKRERPWLTLYAFWRGGKLMLLAIGRAPPHDIGLDWDELTRIPVTRNGAKPTWEAFTVSNGSGQSRGMKRERG